ncbi:MAG TPA: PAS domain S-box protein [Bryobacteraceae bacterium]|nr:PAS domain S-box protein [Bryobacteraceae bacterium]
MSLDDDAARSALAREMIESVEDGLAALDHQFRLIYLNPAGEHLLGVTWAGVAGRTPWEVLGATLGTTFETHCRQLAELRSAQTFELHDAGTQRWLDVRLMPFRDGGASVRFRDITLQKQTAEDEERYRLAAASAEVGIFEWDTRIDRSIWQNKRMYEIFGRSEADGVLSAAEFRASVLHPDDAAVFEETVRAAHQSGQRFSRAWRIRRRNDGEVRWIEMCARFEPDPSGSLVRLVGIVVDITEHRRVEEQLRNQAEELEAIMEVAPVALWVSRDSECRNIVGNRAANDLYRVSKQVNVSQTPEPGEVTPRYRYFCGGRELSPDELPMQRAAATGCEVRNVEVDVLHSDGTRCVAWGNALPLKDSQGVVRGAVGAFLDTTERKRADEALRRSQADLKRAQAVAHTGSWRLDLLRHDMQWSDEMRRIFELPRGGRLSYAEFQEALHPEDRDLVERCSKAALEGKPFDLEHRIITAAGRTKWVRAKVEFEVGPDGTPVGAFGTIQDISERKIADEALRRFELLVADSRDIILFVARDGRILDANAAAISAYRYSREELLELSIYDLRDEGTHATVATQLAEADNRTLLFETVHRRKDGSTFPVEVSSHGADILGTRTLLSIVRDITLRKEAQQKLSEAKDRQEILAEVVGRLLASEEPQRIVNELGRMVMRKVGCDVFFNFFVDPMHGRLRLNASAGIDEEATRILESIEYGTAIAGRVARDGCRIVEEDVPQSTDPRTTLAKSLGILAYACHPLLAGNKVIGTLSFGSRTKSRFSEGDLSLMQAVTDHFAIAMERVRVEKALRESEALYRAVARGIPGGAVYVVDRELRIVAAEGTLLPKLGTSREKLEGRVLQEVIDRTAICELIAERFRRALKGEVAGYETEDRELVLWTQYVPLRDENGRVAAAMALQLDVTERKRVEEQLRHAQKLESIGVLAGGVAHDFNNLLTSVLGNASLARLEAPPSIVEQIESIIDAAEKAAALTRQLLAYAGKGRFQIADLDLARVIRSSADLIRGSIPKNVDLILDVPDNLPTTRGDNVQLQQVIINLVTNAAEAIGEAKHGTVRISAGLRTVGQDHPAEPGFQIPPGQYVCVEVSDSGCGLDEATRARMFDPFFTTKFTGRGLGLAAVQGILRSHKGGITVRSAPGQGSTITVYLPAIAVVVQGASGDGTAAGAEQALTVLVVDDEPAVRSFAKSALGRLGHTVLLAEDGQRAIELLEKNGSVDLVLLDVVMPVIGGGEVAGTIRKRWPDVSVLVTSGYNQEEARRLGSLPEGLPFIPKPYTLQRLASAVRSALASRRGTEHGGPITAPPPQ